MSETQITLIQIDNYGHWTVTPSPRREVDLQTLQSDLYGDISQLVGQHDGCVFFTRFDNMIAVTNGINRDGHRRIQTSIRNRYPITVSLSIGTGASPQTAITDATTRLQTAGSAQDGDRTGILRGEPLGDAEAGSVHIAHFDVNDATERYTDEINAFEVFRRIHRCYGDLSDYLYETYDSLTFFVGGDNIISVTPPLERPAFEDAIEHVEETTGIGLKVGIGRDQTARAAGMTAKQALERCRHDDTRVEIVEEEVGGA